MKKTLLLVLLTTLTLISCQKESDVLPKGNNANYYVENGILNVKNQSVLDSLVAANFEKSEEEVVAWSDSLGFKSLASVYKDAEKEKDALTVEELKAKYEGKLIFNTAKGAEKEFTCAVEDLDMAAFVNEDAEFVINGEIKDLKNINSKVFHPLNESILKAANTSDYHATFDGKRWFSVSIRRGAIWYGHYWSDNDRNTKAYSNSWYVLLDIKTEKKVWGGWKGYNTDLYFRNIQTGTTGGWCISHNLDYNSALYPGRYWAGEYIASGYSQRIWTGGVSESHGITVNVDVRNNLFLSF